MFTSTGPLHCCILAEQLSLIETNQNVDVRAGYKLQMKVSMHTLPYLIIIVENNGVESPLVPQAWHGLSISRNLSTIGKFIPNPTSLLHYFFRRQIVKLNEAALQLHQWMAPLAASPIWVLPKAKAFQALTMHSPLTRLCFLKRPRHCSSCS